MRTVKEALENIANAGNSGPFAIATFQDLTGEARQALESPALTAQRKIESIAIEHLHDEMSDTRDLGEYTNEFKPGAMDRLALGDKHSPHEYRYFVPAMTGEQTGNPDSPMQDYKRAEAYNNQEWHYIGVRCVARVAISTSAGQYWTLHTITSPGIWGIESDSGAEYLAEVAKEQRDELSAILQALGFEAEDISAAPAKKEK